MKGLNSIFIILAVAFGLQACLEKGTHTAVYYRQPGVVGYEGDFYLIRTRTGIYSDTLPENEFALGDYILATYIINEDKVVGSYPTLTGLQAEKVDHSRVRTGPVSESSYPDSIVNMKVFMTSLDTVLFFQFDQRAPKQVIYDYELTYDPDSLSHDTCNFYIKAWKRNVPEEGTDTTRNIYYAVKMDEFVKELSSGRNDEFILRFNYMTGTNKYARYGTEPVVWSVRDGILTNLSDLSKE